MRVRRNMLDIGRVCIKTAGREAGRACVVIDTIDETYVMITGPKGLTRVRRRKCNIAHLEPLEFQLKLAKNASDNEVAKLLQAEKILEKILPGKPVPRPERPREEPKAPKVPVKGKKGLRERILGRAKKEEKKPEKPKEEKPKKPEKPRVEKKEKPKAEERKRGKPKEKPPAKAKPAKKAKPSKKK